MTQSAPGPSATSRKLGRDDVVGDGRRSLALPSPTTQRSLPGTGTGPGPGPGRRQPAPDLRSPDHRVDLEPHWLQAARHLSRNGAPDTFQKARPRPGGNALPGTPSSSRNILVSQSPALCPPGLSANKWGSVYLAPIRGTHPQRPAGRVPPQTPRRPTLPPTRAAEAVENGAPLPVYHSLRSTTTTTTTLNLSPLRG
jgi:hypothetical protein